MTEAIERAQDPASDTEPAALAARFPPGFTWGIASSAYQVEGAVEEDGRGPSIWDTFCREPGRVRNGDSGVVACDHYHRSTEDVALMADLGIGAYRFSIAWPRILPAGRGRPNERGLAFYDRLVDDLLAHGIRPIVNLYHWDLPQVLQDEGGWASPDIVESFAAYAAVVADRLADRVGDWLTINEPQVFAFTGHATGRHAPGIRDWPTAIRVADAALRAHVAAAERIRSARPEARVGLAVDVNRVEPATDAEEDMAAAARHVAVRQGWFLDPLFGRGYPAAGRAAHEAAGHAVAVELRDPPSTPLDFLGVNYYTREVVRADARGMFGLDLAQADAAERTTMRWEVHPEGLHQVLVELHRRYAPPAMIVSENGAAFADRPDAAGRVDDHDRRGFLARHVAAAADALDDGVPLTGYFVWSLLDNFEWDKGYEQRFGLVRVDYATQRRTLKASGDWYRSLVASARGP